MSSRGVTVIVTETITVQKQVEVVIPDHVEFDSNSLLENGLPSEIADLARSEAYYELAVTAESSWDLVGSDGPDFDVTSFWEED
jgi:hypothetical protein